MKWATSNPNAKNANALVKLTLQPYTESAEFVGFVKY
jgi:hypothetical protein